MNDDDNNGNDISLVAIHWQEADYDIYFDEWNVWYEMNRKLFLSDHGWSFGNEILRTNHNL